MGGQHPGLCQAVQLGHELELHGVDISLSQAGSGVVVGAGVVVEVVAIGAVVEIEDEGAGVVVTSAVVVEDVVSRIRSF